MSIQLKRSLVSAINSNYVLKQGQVGIEMPDEVNTSSSPFKFKIGDGTSNWRKLPHAAVTPDQLHSYVPTTRTVNGKALSENITLSASDVSARASTWTPSASDVGAVPTTRKVNGKALNADITLAASDVGARPNTWTPTAADVGAATSSHTHTASDVGAAESNHSHSGYLSGTVSVSNGGTGLTTITSGAALIGNGTSSVSTRSITNNTSTSSSITANTNLITANTLRYMINRTSSVAAANTSYTTYMARGSIITNTTPTSMTNGTVAFIYS